jgi:ABC-type oligopeptide transport system substrate-binding subunit
MKKLFAIAFAIIALASCSGNGCSRSESTSDSTTVVDTINKVDTLTTDSTVCPD